MLICTNTFYHVKIYISKIFLNKRKKWIKVQIKRRSYSIAKDWRIFPGHISQIILGQYPLLAVILTLPALGVFIAVSQNSGNILIGSVIGFGLHFLLLSASGRISSAQKRSFQMLKEAKSEGQTQ